MFRWYSPAVAGLALVLVVAGCGPVLRSAERIETALFKVEMAWMPNRLDFTVYHPPHRVALTTSEVLKAELAEVKILDVELTRDKNFDTPEGKPPEMGSVVIPKDYSAFWLEGSSISKSPILVNCRLVSFSGKTKEGEKVNVSIRLEIVGSDQRTVERVQVGGHGDSTRSKLLIDMIMERIQNPSTRPDSPEERAALKSAFDPGPKGKVNFSSATGEINIKMDRSPQPSQKSEKSENGSGDEAVTPGKDTPA